MTYKAVNPQTKQTIEGLNEQSAKEYRSNNYLIYNKYGNEIEFDSQGRIVEYVQLKVNDKIVDCPARKYLGRFEIHIDGKWIKVRELAEWLGFSLVKNNLITK